MVHQIKVKIQAPILSIKMVRLHHLTLGQAQLLLVEEAEGVLAAQLWELMNGVGREKIIMLVLLPFRLFGMTANQSNRKR